MRTEVIRDTRLLDALEYIDDAYIASAARYKMKYAPASADEPKITWRTPLKHIKIYIALAASLLLLAMASPLVSFFTYVVSNFTAGAGSGTESSEILNTELTEPLETTQSTDTDSIESTQSLDTEPTYTQPVFQYVITREEFDEMTEAWKRFRNRETAYIEKNYEHVTYWYPCQGWTCVYKKETDYVVYCRHNSECWYGEMTIAGYLFKLPHMEEIWVYMDKNFYSISEAYNNGILSEEDIRELAEIHHEHLYGENRFG